MITAVLNVHLHLRTYRYTSVFRGEPPSHESTIYGKISTTYNIYDGSRRCVIASQPLPKVVTLSTADNTFHIYGICLNRSREAYSLHTFVESDSHNWKTVKPTSKIILEFLRWCIVPSEFLKSFLPTLDLLAFQDVNTLYYFTFKITNVYLASSNRTNRCNRNI